MTGKRWKAICLGVTLSLTGVVLHAQDEVQYQKRSNRYEGIKPTGLDQRLNVSIRWNSGSNRTTTRQIHIGDADKHDEHPGEKQADEHSKDKHDHEKEVEHK